jgi:amino acid transporter
MTDGHPPVRPRVVRGLKAGDRRVRVERPHAAYFRYSGEGTLIAREAASVPRTPLGRAVARVRAFLFGRPLSSHADITERLSKVKALAIFSSDAISSSAYATEEILRVLVLAGAAAMFSSIGVSAAIALLLAVVAFSYRQVCRAFPYGGGAYAVARSELTPLLGLIAAAALLIDYVMTVAVSTSSALDQLASLVPQVADPVTKVSVAVAVITLITIANLRGLRESGNIFAVPTYVFVVLALGIVGLGFLNIVTGHVVPRPLQPNPQPFDSQPLMLFLLLRAFASGSVALTGVEAIANGVPAFKPPEAKNAANTMTAMAVLLGIIFIGISIVANAYGVVPSVGGSPSVVSLVAGSIYGDGSILHGLFLVATMLILFLAANTSYNAFPRLAAILAEDGYMPRQFAFRGDRLAYSWGIVLLAGIAAGLLALFQGTTTLLIPLYSVGVFVCFTLSQVGMVRHWLRRRQLESGWQWRLVVNGFGALLTLVVLVIVVYEKFLGGAYLVVILIPTLVAIMLFIHRQYEASSRELEVREDVVFKGPQREERVIVPVPGITRAVVQAVNVARSIAPDVQAILVSDEPEAAARTRDRWERQIPDVPLVIVESPFRALIGPLLAYLDVLDQAWPADKEQPITFIVIPEYVARSWWERILYNQSAKRLRQVLLGRPHTVVVNVPYRRDDQDAHDPGHRDPGHPVHATTPLPPR